MERSVLIKEVNTQDSWNFEIGTQNSVNVPIWIIVGFKEKDRQNSQIFNNFAFYRSPIKSAR